MIEPPKQDRAVRSLAAQSRRQLVLLAVVIFVGLVSLVSAFSFYQINQAMENYTRLEASKLEQRILQGDQDPVYASSITAYRSWQEIPKPIQMLFSQSDATKGRILDSERMLLSGEREYVYLMFSDTSQEGGVFVVEIEDAETIDSLIQATFEHTLWDASFIIGLFIVLFFLAIAWIFHNAIKPLKYLVEWSKQIKRQPEDSRVAQFPISELNDIAEHLLASLQQVKDYNEREQQFLKHASHELRTPIAIVQASLDTLSLRTPEGHPSYKAIQRANRASHNMIRLTEALLWLGRQSSHMPSKTIIHPALVCSELIEDMRYLIDEKQLQVQLDADAHSLAIEEPLFRIVLANLIRNAFQHSAQGVILVNITERCVTITNPVEPVPEPSVSNFGLGLQLVERITAKLAWQFDAQIGDTKAVVSVRW